MFSKDIAIFNLNRVILINLILSMLNSFQKHTKIHQPRSTLSNYSTIRCVLFVSKKIYGFLVLPIGEISGVVGVGVSHFEAGNAHQFQSSCLPFGSSTNKCLVVFCFYLLYFNVLYVRVWRGWFSTSHGSCRPLPGVVSRFVLRFLFTCFVVPAYLLTNRISSLLI